MTPEATDPAARVVGCGADDSIFKGNHSGLDATAQSITISFGTGIRCADGERRCVQAEASLADAVQQLLHNLPRGTEVWYSFSSWRGNHRCDKDWESSSGIALDIDIMLPSGKRPLPGQVPVDTCIEAAREGRLAGNLIYATPRGVRLIFVFTAAVTDKDLYLKACRGAAAIAERSLGQQGLDNYHVDKGALSRATSQPSYAPRTLVDGFERNAPVVIIRRTPYEANELAEVAPAPPPRGNREHRSARCNDPDFLVAVGAFIADHPIECTTRTCPTCGHNDCFNKLPGDETKWFCWSENHEADSGGCGLPTYCGWVGDALDIEAHRRDMDPGDVLRDDGYLPQSNSRVVVLSEAQKTALMRPRNRESPVDLNEARTVLARWVRFYIQAGGRGVTVIQAPPGVGKTHGVLLVIQDLILKGQLTARVLFLADTHQQLVEWREHPEFSDLMRRVVIRHGRTTDRHSPGFCQDLADNGTAAQRQLHLRADDN